MISLGMLPFEFVKPFLPCFELLNRCNFKFFDENISHVKKYWRHFYIIPCLGLYHLSLTVYLVKTFSKKTEFYELVFAVPVYVVSTQAVFKILIVASKKKEIQEIIMQMGAVWRTKNLTKNQINQKNTMLKKLDNCYVTFYWFNIIGAWQYILAPLLETLFRRFILQQECELLLPFACSYPFDPAKNWYRYIGTYIFETYNMFRIVYFYVGTEFVMINLCAHLTTEFILLKEDLRNIKPSPKTGGIMDESKHVNYGIDDFIRDHQVLIRLSNQLNFIFNKLIFVNLTSATFTICFFGFAAKVARGLLDMATNFVAVAALILPIFNLCYYAELLKGASTGIAESAYDNLWYLQDTRFQQKIRFIIRRSQKPCYLTSLEYTPITLNTFTTVMSNTWSYFSVVTSLYEGN